MNDFINSSVEQAARRRKQLIETGPWKPAVVYYEGWFFAYAEHPNGKRELDGRYKDEGAAWSSAGDLAMMFNRDGKR